MVARGKRTKPNATTASTASGTIAASTHCENGAPESDGSE